MEDDQTTGDARWEDDVRQAWADVAPEEENVVFTALPTCPKCNRELEKAGCIECVADDDPGYDATAIARDLVYRQQAWTRSADLHTAAYAAMLTAEALVSALRDGGDPQFPECTSPRLNEAGDALNAIMEITGYYAAMSDRYERQVAASLKALAAALPAGYTLKAVPDA